MRQQGQQRRNALRAATAALVLLLCASARANDGRFVNFESPQVHPLDQSPSRDMLAACNTANGTVDVFSTPKGVPVFEFSVAVGVDPVSVRFRTDSELWVVNWISDSISIIDLERRAIVRTLLTRNEPADVVFGGNGVAFVACSQPNLVLAFDTADLAQPPRAVPLVGKFPRAMARSADGRQVYVAFFQSGNRSTLLAHDIAVGMEQIVPDKVVSRPDGPHGGKNPPFNADGQFSPPMAPGLPPPPPTDLIVKQDASGAWRDDTGADWTRFVSGDAAAASGRVPGWRLADHDVAIIDTETLAVSYVSGMMNMCMGLAVRPGTGELTVVGTDATNEVRFEPNVRGTFVKAVLSIADPAAAMPKSTADLNGDLFQAAELSAEPQRRNRAVGEPRAITWNAPGTLAWIAGSGSNNVVRSDFLTGPIPVDAGPTGLAHDDAQGKLHVLCRFGASIVTVDVSSGQVVHRAPLYDPTPAAIREGRPFLYDTHATSGLGQASCASCHVDARSDGLAWDLGDPQGKVKSSADRNILRRVARTDADDYHPMKGPRTTQTLQDIIGNEPFHWSGDRDGIEAFSGAFETLLGGDAPLAPEPMEKLKRFLGSIQIPPNPYRTLDNALPETVDFGGMLAPAAPGATRVPLPPGNPRRGLEIYASGDGGCMECHTLPSGRGTPSLLEDYQFRPMAHGPHAARHLRVVTGANTSVQMAYKVPPFFPVQDKLGLDLLSVDGSTMGFGLFSAGALDSAVRFVLAGGPAEENGQPAGRALGLQDAVDLFALLLAWPGSDFPITPDGSPLQPPGLPARDSHAALGAQVTLPGDADAPARLDTLRSAVERSPRIELIAKGRRADAVRGWWYQGEGVFLGDRTGETATFESLLQSSAPGAETTFTVVAAGTGRRLGIDRDLDGMPDADDAKLDAVALDAGETQAPEGPCPACDASTPELQEGATLCLRADTPAAVAFQWSRDGAALANGPRVSGAFCDTLQLTSITAAEAGAYRVDFVDPNNTRGHKRFEVRVVAAQAPRPWSQIAAETCVALALLGGILALAFRSRKR